LFPPTRAPRDRSTALSCATVSDSTRTASNPAAVDAALDDDDDDDDASVFFSSSAASDAEVARGGRDARAGFAGNGASRANRRIGGDGRRARVGVTPLSRTAHGAW
jgi:hypothetical protein